MRFVMRDRTQKETARQRLSVGRLIDNSAMEYAEQDVYIYMDSFTSFEAIPITPILTVKQAKKIGSARTPKA